jgi:hypothetical protein
MPGKNLDDTQLRASGCRSKQFVRYDVREDSAQEPFRPHRLIAVTAYCDSQDRAAARRRDSMNILELPWES